MWSALSAAGSWTDRTLLDLGCGTGFHLPRFAETAARVIGVEPHPDLVRLAGRRTRGLKRVDLLTGTAQAIPLPDASVDVVHARWAYFFGPGAEPGLAEVARVLRPGGTALIVDNDASRSTFGAWFRHGYPQLDPAPVQERWWDRQGFARQSIDMDWRFASRADLEAVVRIEFTREVADTVLRGHVGVEVDYAVNLFSRTY